MHENQSTKITENEYSSTSLWPPDSVFAGSLPNDASSVGEPAGFKQQEVSDFEAKADLSDEVLLRLLEPLGVTLEKFKEMDEGAFGATVYHVHDQGQAFGPFGVNNNPIDKLMELMDELKKVYQEKEALHERLLEAEKERAAFLQGQLDKSK